MEITDPMLSKQVDLLEAVGYVGVDKGRVGRRTRTWLDLTPDGRAAYRGTSPRCARSPARR